METKNILGSIVSLTVAVICLAVIMMPVLNDVMETAGEEVTYTNTLQTNTNRYDYVDSVEMTATVDSDTGLWTDHTVNGQEIALINDYMLAIVSDGFTLQIGNNGQLAINFPTDPYDSSVGGVIATSEETFSIEMENGNYTIEGGTSGTLYTGVYDWVVTYVENGKYIAHSSNPTNYYCNGVAKDFIFYGSVYTSGDLDTYYAYGNGELTVSVSDYSGKLNFTTTLVDGTTDVYRVSAANITITDSETETSETFTPYRCLVQYEVTGHEASGAAYSLYAAIPIIVIVGIVIASIGMVVTRRD